MAGVREIVLLIITIHTCSWRITSSDVKSPAVEVRSIWCGSSTGEVPWCPTCYLKGKQVIKLTKCVYYGLPSVYCALRHRTHRTNSIWELRVIVFTVIQQTYVTHKCEFKITDWWLCWTAQLKYHKSDNITAPHNVRGTAAMEILFWCQHVTMRTMSDTLQAGDEVADGAMAEPSG